MRSLQHLNKYFYKYRYTLAMGVLFISFSNFFAIFPARVIRESLDTVQSAITNPASSHNDIFSSELIQKLFLFGIIILGSALLKGIFMFFMRQTIIVMSRHIEYDLKNEMYEHCQKLSVSFYKRNNTGDLMARISEDVSKVRMYVGPAIMYAIQTITLFIFIITAMFWVNPILTLYVLIPLPALSICMYYINNQINKKSDVVQTQLSRLSTLAQETFSGIRILKSYSKEKVMADQYKKESFIYKKQALSLSKAEAFFVPAIIVLMGLSMLLAIYIGGKQAISGEISIGNIVEFVYYINMLTWPVASVGWVSSIIQRAAASQERINIFLKTPPDINNSYQNNHYTLKGSITFNNVSFTYPNTGVRALKKISFHVEQGESIGIIGKTGSGKSTIANLITRLNDVSDGEVLIDNKNIKELSLSETRKNIGYVPQDIFLFSDTISNNILFGQHAKSTDNNVYVINAAQNSHIYDNIIEFPEKFDTYIGERGVTLSGGQKQRVSIARAIIGSPKILVFDDCLSAVDTQTEDIILNNLKTVMQNKTTIVISHRVSAVKNTNKIIVLHSGEIVEFGKHEELLKNKGVYYNLYQKQLLENKKSNVDIRI